MIELCASQRFPRPARQRMVQRLREVRLFSRAVDQFELALQRHYVHESLRSRRLLRNRANRVLRSFSGNCVTGTRVFRTTTFPGADVVSDLNRSNAEDKNPSSTNKKVK